MKFDEWWATLTEKEQKEIGLHNAKFVWNAAVVACLKVFAKGNEASSHQGGHWERDDYIVEIANLKAQTQLFDDWDVTWTKSNT